MDEEAQKRNTDCLYFLASPLTCKKGIECEYRHSDNARLNPRDCWYWLNGNCRNPNCAFRHPPLEGLTGIKADSFYTPSFSTVPATKSNVPCYFYFNAVCAKGEQCPFLHETFPAQKSASKIAPESTTSRNPLENKSSAGDTGPASVELPGNPPAESLVGPIKMDNHHLKEALRSPSVESVAPECEEPPVENLLPSVEFMDRQGQLSPYSSSEGELMKECVGQELEERWESSPGFDVLVDDGSEQLAYEDDAEYQLIQNCEESELRHGHLLKYDFDGSGYELPSGFPDAGYLYDGLYENYDHTDDTYGDVDYFQGISELPREERRIFEPIYDDLRERALLRRVHEFDDRDGIMDLQERLGHQRTDARWIPSNSRKRRRANPHGRGGERPGRRGDGSIHCRLGSQVGRCPIAASSLDEDEFTRNHHDRQGTSRVTRSKNRERERRRRFPSRVSSEAHQGSARDGEESAGITSNGGFDGPKTLAQIKEERNRAKAENGQNCRERLPLRTRQAAVDFEGPKPLEELLKHKSSGTPRSSACERMENLGADECEDDEGDDVDAFRKRLARALSH